MRSALRRQLAGANALAGKTTLLEVSRKGADNWHTTSYSLPASLLGVFLWDYTFDEIGRRSLHTFPLQPPSAALPLDSKHSDEIRRVGDFTDKMGFLNAVVTTIAPILYVLVELRRI